MEAGGLALLCGVKADGVAGFQALNERLEGEEERAFLFHVEHFAAGLGSHFANIARATEQFGGKAGFGRVAAGNFDAVDGGVGFEGLLDDGVVIDGGGGSDIIADENNDAAGGRSFAAEILRGVVEALVDVGAAAGEEVFDLVGDVAFVAGERDAQLGIIGEGEESDLVFRLERFEGAESGVAQRAQKWLDGAAKVEDESDGQRELVAAEVRDGLRLAVGVEEEVILLEVFEDAAGTIFDGGFEQEEIDVHFDGGAEWLLGGGMDDQGNGENDRQEHGECATGGRNAARDS